MIAISTQFADINGDVIFEENPESNLKRGQARVTQVATLDGNSVVYHSGFSHGDRVISIEATVSKEVENKLWNIFTTQSMVYLSNSEGFFQGAIRNVDAKNGEITLDFTVRDKLQ